MLQYTSQYKTVFTPESQTVHLSELIINLNSSGENTQSTPQILAQCIKYLIQVYSES